MKKINLSEEELEMMNYNDIAYVILEANGKKMKILDLFKEVSILLNSDPDDQSKITDLFQLLSTDKRFIMLDDGYWDLRIKHNKGMVIEAEDEEEELLLEDNDSDEEDIYDDENDENKDIDDDVEEDDLSDLVIIDDSDEENNM